MKIIVIKHGWNQTRIWGGGCLNFENWKDNISKSGLDRSRALLLWKAKIIIATKPILLFWFIYISYNFFLIFIL